MDAQCGGLPSPVLTLPDGAQRFFPLPIPYAHSDLQYAQLRLFDDYSAWDFIRDVAPAYKQLQTCHLDPDLRKDYVSERAEHWKPAFGQVAAAQTHLQNGGVGPGDLFLFFGWFQFAVRKNGKFAYSRTPDFPAGFHAIYGYLQIGEIYKPTVEDVPAWLRYHPHVAQKEHGVFKKLSNTIYTATENLNGGVAAGTKSGAGWFDFDERLILTKRGSANRTVWALPRALHPDNGVALSYHAEKSWSRSEEETRLRSASQGQEFIFTTDAAGAAQQWAINLLNGSAASMGI